MRAVILVTALAMAPAVWAQSTDPVQESQTAGRPPLEAVTCYVPAQSESADAEGQAKPKRPQPANPADVETLTGRSYPVEMRPAPKPGHALDPGDVAVLTGKTSRRAQGGYAGSVAPYVYYPVNAALLDQYGNGRASGRRPLFVSRLFPRFVP